jgi:hypothetical protein
VPLRLDDRKLWGNEAADDEDPEILNSYFVNQPDWHEFFNPRFSLSIARARKGMGKSALLRECAFRLRGQPDTLVIAVKGADLVAQRDFRSLTASEQLYDWQQRICAIINRHLSLQIGFALKDDAIALVENAELSGFKSRNIVGALLDRLKGKIGAVELQKLSIVDNKAVMGRTLNPEKAQVCLLIDDIDATFTESKEENIRLSTFFSACRELTANYKGITIRTVVRSDVWATIRKTDEALDKVEQYIFDINWSVKGFRSVLAERITSYCQRIGQADLTKNKSKDQINELVFNANYPWGRYTASPHRVIHVYAGGRPRWAAQLCRMAGAEAIRVGTSDVIKFGHIKQVLQDYGRYRLDDVSREHRHQCPTVMEIVNSFGNRQTTYTTSELVLFVREIILPNIDVKIDGAKVAEPLAVARFLYRIGFILAVDRLEHGQPEYYQFEEKPELLRNASNLDNGMQWRVHPSYQAALGLAGMSEI